MQTINASTFSSASALIAALADAGEIVQVTDVTPEMRESMSSFLDHSAECEGYEDVWGTDDDGRDFRAYLMA